MKIESKYFSRTQRQIIFLCIGIFLFSCNKQIENKGEIIELNPLEATNEILLSEFIDSIQYIKLKTDSNTVIGRIHEIVIKDKYIYVQDISQGIIFVFDKTGTLKSKLDKMGRGPDEYTKLGPFFIDSNEDFVEIINWSGKYEVLKYTNITFELISKKPMARISANACRKFQDKYYFSTQQIDNIVNGEKTNSDILIVDNGEIVKTLFEKNIVTENSYFTPNTESFTINNNNELFVSLMFHNTFYQLDKLEAVPLYTVDFGRLGLKNSMGRKPIEKQLAYIGKATGLASFPVLNINNTNMMSFSYYFNEDKNSTGIYHYIRFKGSNKIYHTNRIKNDISGFPELVHLSSYYNDINHEVWYKNYLVDIILPSFYYNEEKNGETIEGLGEITIDDNPIIVLMKLKNEFCTDKKGDKKTIVEFATRTIDFGVVSNDTLLQAMFNIKNSGLADLEISGVSPDCSCIEYELGNTTVQSGDSTDLIVNFIAKEGIPGMHRKAINIVTNTDKEYNTLFIKYYIKKK